MLQRKLLEAHNLGEDLLEQAREHVKTLTRVEEFEEYDTEPPVLAPISKSTGGGAGAHFNLL